MFCNYKYYNCKTIFNTFRLNTYQPMKSHEKLKLKRILQNLTQEAMATKLNMSQNAYSLLENGKTRIDEQKIMQIAKALQIKPKDLISDELLD